MLSLLQCCLNYRAVLRMASTSPQQTPQDESSQEGSPQLSSDVCADISEQSSPRERSLTDVDEGDDSNKLVMEVSQICCYKM